MLYDSSARGEFSVLSALSDTNDRADQSVIFEDHGPQSSDVGASVPGCGCPSCCESRLDADLADQPFNAVTDYTALLVPNFNGDFTRWNWNGDTPAIGTTFITYSFREDADLPDPANVAYQPTGVYSFSASQRDETRDALAVFTAISGIVFVEVEQDGMLDFIGVTGSGFGGFAYYPNIQRGVASGVYMEGDTSTDFSTYILLHEIGHAVGLKHPFEGGVTLTTAVDNTDNTVMSYTFGTQSVTDLGPLDVDALRFLYGNAQDLNAAGISHSWDEVNDTLTVIGGSGNDNLSGVADINIISGGGGDDTILGGVFNDELNGDAGNDTLVGGWGDDELDGGNNDDKLDGGDGNDILRGGNGNDELLGGIGNDLLQGGANNDYLDGSWGTNILEGGGGNDTLVSSQSTDTLRGDGGNDTIIVWFLSSSQTIDGGAGTDTLAFTSATNGVWVDLSNPSYNISSIEILQGTDFDDTLTGSDSAETILGGDGNDTIRGKLGADLINGGNGFDLAYYWGSAAGVSINLETGVATGGEADGDTFISIEGIVGSTWNDVLVGDGNDNTFVYVGGNDSFDGGGGLDAVSFEYYSVNQRVDLAAGTFQWQSGSNFFNWGANTYTSIEGVITGSGNDDVQGSADANRIEGRAGNDILHGGGGDDVILGGEGNDTLDGGDGIDLLNGGIGDDSLRGSSGVDTLNGGDGNDTLFGGRDDEILSGDRGDELLNGGSAFGSAHG